MRPKPVSLVATFLLGLMPMICSAQDFSGDVLYLAVGKPDGANSKGQNSAHTPSKLYVSKDKMRLETRGLTGTILLVNGAEQTAFALFPAKKEYQPLASAPSQYFRVVDTENACSDWQKASNEKIVCEKVGHEAVNGRDAVKYANKTTRAEAATTAVWIDSALHFVIKWEGTDSGAELHDIKEGPQAPDLFLVPSSYELLKPMKAANKAPKNRTPTTRP